MSEPRVVEVCCYLKHWIVLIPKNGGHPSWSLSSTSRKTHGRISFTDLEFNTKDAAVEYAVEIAKKISEYYADVRVDVLWFGAVKETILVKAPVFEEPKWNPPRVIEQVKMVEEDIGEPYEPHSVEINEFGKDIRHIAPRMHAR
jgi:hypothetical protein